MKMCLVIGCAYEHDMAPKPWLGCCLQS